MRVVYDLSQAYAVEQGAERALPCGQRGPVMSGNFVIVFGDGRKLEGSFKAKYIKPAGPFICE